MVFQRELPVQITSVLNPLFPLGSGWRRVLVFPQNIITHSLHVVNLARWDARQPTHSEPSSVVHAVQSMHDMFFTSHVNACTLASLLLALKSSTNLIYVQSTKYVPYVRGLGFFVDYNDIRVVSPLRPVPSDLSNIVCTYICTICR